MVRRMALMVCLMVGCLLCLTLTTRGANAQKVRAAFKPVASVHALMEGQGNAFNALSLLLKDPEAPQRLPRLRSSAELLAELANVNTFNSDEADYVRFAEELRGTAMELSKEAAKAAKADDTKMRGLYDKLKITCTNCHDQYQ